MGPARALHSFAFPLMMIYPGYRPDSVIAMASAICENGAIASDAGHGKQTKDANQACREYDDFQF